MKENSSVDLGLVKKKGRDLLGHGLDVEDLPRYLFFELFDET